MTTGMTQQAQQSQHTSQVRAATAATQTDDLPSLAEIRGGEQFAKARNLDEASLNEAIKGARALEIENHTAIVDFGIEEQQEATRFAEKTVEYSRKNDFAAIRATTEEMTERMRELSMGDLKSSIWDKLLPSRAAKRVKNVLSQHQEISEQVRESIQALGSEKQKLMEYRAAAEIDIAGSEKLISRFDIKIAELEIARDTFQRRMEKFLEENKDSQDESVPVRLKHFQMVASLIERKVNALVSSRADQFTTLENLRNMQATYNVLIQAAEDQANYNIQAWNNTVSVLTHAARQKGVQEAIDSQRQAAGTWLQARGDAGVKTVENTMRVLQTGVIELERVTESIDRAEEANLKLIEGCKAAQDKLLEMSKTITERSAAASARTAAAARATHAEVTQMIGDLSANSLPQRER